MGSYGFDAKDFAEMGLSHGSPIDLRVEGEDVKNAVLDFNLMGAGFLYVDVLYNSSRASIYENNYKQGGRRYKHRIHVHEECIYPKLPFNKLAYDNLRWPGEPNGVSIVHDGITYNEAWYQEQARQKELASLKVRLANLPGAIEKLRNSESEIRARIEALESEAPK